MLATSALPAHRLDECLQAARIAVEEDRVEVALGLTPGMAVAGAIIADIDRDRDGVLSNEEQRDYAGRIVDAVRLTADGRELELSLLDATFPELATIRSGEGVVQLRLRAAMTHTPGTHHVVFRNAFRRDSSVYLANALVPASDRIDVTAQRRDGDQSELTIEYVVRPADEASLPWWLLGSLTGFTAGATFLGRTRLRQRMRARSIAPDPQ
jgi:hypothetical protein